MTEVAVFSHLRAIRRKRLSEPVNAIGSRERANALHQMPFLVARPIQRSAPRAAAITLDLGCGVQIIGDEAAQRLGVVARVSHDMTDTRKTRDSPFDLRAVGPMARRAREPDRQAGRIHSRVNLGCQPTARAADGVSLKPPFCEVASA